jgi:hypothetical protein
MSPAEGPSVAGETVCEEEGDYNLLTFREAAARLDAKIRALTAQVASPMAAGEESAQVVKARARLEQLCAAADSNSRRPITDENFARFFGYEGKARRNTM